MSKLKNDLKSKEESLIKEIDQNLDGIVSKGKVIGLASAIGAITLWLFFRKRQKNVNQKRRGNVLVKFARPLITSYLLDFLLKIIKRQLGSKRS